MAVTVEQRFPSPLRYPGGKGKLAGFIKLFMLKNGLVGSEYVEPYAGGASVALHLLFEEYASHIHINDLNPSVAAFWRAVLEDPEALCDRIQKARVTVDEWHRQREIQARDGATDLDLGYSTFFLNRTSRSGIIGGGIIGGFEQAGEWKIDARFNRDDLVRRVRKIARYRSRITVTELDAHHYLRNVLPEVADPFVYLDPPYYVKGEGLYQNFYEHRDHVSIAQLVREIDTPWVVSYDADPAIETLYDGLPAINYSLNYSAQDRYRGTELIVCHPRLTFPQVKTPANVPWRLVNDVRTGACSV